MKINVKITQVFTPRRGTNAQTGQVWCIQPVRVEWSERVTRKSDGSIYTIPHSLAVDLTGSIAEKFVLPVGTFVTLDLKCETSEYNGRCYNNIRSSYCNICGAV